MASLLHASSQARGGLPSTSGRQASRPLVPARGRCRLNDSNGRRLVIRRVTNTSEEIYRYMGVPNWNGEDLEEIEVDQTEVHHPELGPLERRVGKFYLEELLNDSGVDLEETAYWFHTPPGGWTTKPLKLKAAEEAPIAFPQPQHMDAEKYGRTMIEDLREGEVVTGIVTDCWLYHGIQVDFGADFDGLVPIFQDTWMQPGVRDVLLPGMQIKARIYKVRQPGLYRWPVQLQLIEPAATAAKLAPPEAYDPPIDHGWCAEQGWDMDDICRATGRQYMPAQYMLGPDQADWMEELEDAYGYDHQDNTTLDSWAEHPFYERLMIEEQARICHVASELMLGQ